MSKTRQPQVRSLSARFSPGHIIDWHEHSWCQLLYASEGVVTVEVEKACWIVPSHRGIWVPEGQMHRVKMHGQVFLQTIYLSPAPREMSRAKCIVLEVSKLMQSLIVHICNIGIVRGDTEEHRTTIDFLHFQLLSLAQLPLVIPMPSDERARRLAVRIIDERAGSSSLQLLSLECGSRIAFHRLQIRIFFHLFYIHPACQTRRKPLASGAQAIFRPFLGEVCCCIVIGWIELEHFTIQRFRSHVAALESASRGEP